MSYSLAELSPKLRSNSQVLELVDQVASAKRAASNAREKAKHSVSPGKATLDIQAGALAHGALEGLVGERAAPVVQGTAALVAFGAGLWLGSADAVLFANGLLAPMSSAQGFKLVTMARGARGTPDPFPQAK